MFTSCHIIIIISSNIVKPGMLAQPVMLLSCIQEVFGSDLGRDTNYLD
jgi:hypothetical protein